jgi:hypothetical protein
VDRFALVAASQRWTLGRAAGEVDVVMNHPSVSRRTLHHFARRFLGEKLPKSWRNGFLTWFNDV